MLTIAVIAALSMLSGGVLVAVPAEAQGSSQFVFQGAGWGHGVGMSQNGARNAANDGLDHVDILNFYYPNTIVSQVAPLETIRVHLGDASLVEMTSAGSITFERGGVAINAIPSGSITVSAHDGGLQIGNAWTTGSPTNPLYVTFPQPMKLSNNGHRYLWGRIQLTNKNGKVRVVEVLPLEKYVAGISEMPASWPPEALMAQAIAARTYAHEITLHRRNSTEWAQEYDISGSTVDQNYIGYDAQDSAWDQKWLAAVTATAGVEIVDSNGPIRAYYSATNGGYTETAAYVFSKDVPYTVAGPDPYDEGGHDWTTWTRTYTQQSMSRWLNAHSDTSVGTLNAINVLGGHGASARLDKAVVELVGSSGTKRVTGRRLMLVINAGVFGEGGGLSTHLPGTFTTIGNGAGVGAPKPSGAPVPAGVTPDPVAEGVSVNAGFTPPPGWRPEAGTGIAPGRAVVPATAAAVETTDESDARSRQASTSTYRPPAGWQPEPGTGVPPGKPVPPGTASAAESNAAAPAVGGTSTAFTLPPGWQPEPGTGVPPGNPTRPIVASRTATATANAMPAPGSSSFTPPSDWQPEAGTGVRPAADRDHVGGTGGGDALASGVFLVTRTATGTELTDTNFAVIAPAAIPVAVPAAAPAKEPSAVPSAEARERLERLQAKAALGLFANLDIDGYVASVAPRPVHAVCTATVQGITCVPLAALKGDN